MQQSGSKSIGRVAALNRALTPRVRCSSACFKNVRDSEHSVIRISRRRPDGCTRGAEAGACAHWHVATAASLLPLDAKRDCVHWQGFCPAECQGKYANQSHRPAAGSFCHAGRRSSDTGCHPGFKQRTVLTTFDSLSKTQEARLS